MIYQECQYITTFGRCSQPGEYEPDTEQKKVQMKIDSSSMGGFKMYPLKKKKYCYLHGKIMNDLLKVKTRR